MTRKSVMVAAVFTIRNIQKQKKSIADVTSCHSIPLSCNISFSTYFSTKHVCTFFEWWHFLRHLKQRSAMTAPTKNLEIFWLFFLWCSRNWTDDMTRTSAPNIIWKIRYRLRKDEVSEFTGNWALIMVRNTANDKNTVTEYDIFSPASAGTTNASTPIKPRQTIGRIMLMT